MVQNDTECAKLRQPANESLLGIARAQGLRERFDHQAIMVVALLFFSAFINFLDRQTLSIVAPLLRDQFALSNIGYSRIVFAFLLGYAVSQTFMGTLIDRIGTRNGMLISVAAWSVAAMLHGLAAGFLSFCLARLFLGIAEAGNWPGSVKSISETVPQRHRAVAIGIITSGFFIAAVLAPPIVVGLVRAWGWRWMFGMVGFSGIVWTWCWAGCYGRNDSNPSQTANRPVRTPTLHYLRESAVWGLVGARFLADPVWWFYSFWLPEYLVRSRGFDLASIGHVLWLPFLFAAVGSAFGGYASGVLIRRGRFPVSARKIVMVIGAFLMLLGIPAFLAHRPLLAVSWICLVLFGYSMWAANILSLAADLFAPKEVGRITGLGGTAGAIGGMLFTLLTGWLVQKVSYSPVFVLASVMIFFAAACVIWLIPVKRAACT
jgi:MFS transporter, ACS family, hexuronate transporter